MCSVGICDLMSCSSLFSVELFGVPICNGLGGYLVLVYHCSRLTSRLLSIICFLAYFLLGDKSHSLWGILSWKWAGISRCSELVVGFRMCLLFVKGNG